MSTYTCKRQDITQITLKRLPGGEECREKNLYKFRLLTQTTLATTAAAGANETLK
jgi:hypothetical protein